RFLREHHIEHEQVILVHVREHRRFVAIRREVDGVAFFPQALLDESGNFAIVLNDEKDRKSTRLNSSHGSISYAVFCLKKKNPWQKAGDGGRAMGQPAEATVGRIKCYAESGRRARINWKQISGRTVYTLWSLAT